MRHQDWIYYWRVQKPLLNRTSWHNTSCPTMQNNPVHMLADALSCSQARPLSCPGDKEQRHLVKNSNTSILSRSTQQLQSLQVKEDQMTAVMWYWLPDSRWNVRSFLKLKTQLFWVGRKYQQHRTHRRNKKMMRHFRSLSKCGSVLLKPGFLTFATSWVNKQTAWSKMWQNHKET